MVLKCVEFFPRKGDVFFARANGLEREIEDVVEEGRMGGGSTRNKQQMPISG